MVQFSNGRALAGYSYSPNHLKTGPFKIWLFLTGFQMVFDKMAAICQEFYYSFWMDAMAWRLGWTPSVIDTLHQPLLDHSKSRLGCISDPHCLSI